MSHAAWQEDVNDRPARRLVGAQGFVVGATLQTQELTERQAEPADETYIKKRAPRRPAEMSRIVVPGSCNLRFHRSISPLLKAGRGPVIRTIRNASSILALPKKRCLELSGAKIPPFIGAREFQTPFFGQSPLSSKKGIPFSNRLSGNG